MNSFEKNVLLVRLALEVYATSLNHVSSNIILFSGSKQGYPDVLVATAAVETCPIQGEAC